MERMSQAQGHCAFQSGQHLARQWMHRAQRAQPRLFSQWGVWGGGSGIALGALQLCSFLHSAGPRANNTINTAQHTEPVTTWENNRQTVQSSSSVSPHFSKCKKHAESESETRKIKQWHDCGCALYSPRMQTDSSADLKNCKLQFKN